MAKSKTYKITSLSLAFLILFSSSGLTLDIHFCQGKMKRVNLFGKAKSCIEVSQSTKPCHSSSFANISCGKDGDHKGCCKNKSLDLNLDFDSGEININQLVDIKTQLIGSTQAYQFINLSPTQKLLTYTHYFPPPLIRDIPIVFQTFLL